MDTFAADVAAGRLPNAGIVIPNTCNDAHDSDCTTGDADAWMRQQVGPVLAGTRLHSGNLAVVITANEDDASQDNTILTALIHPSQRSHVVTTPLNHYALTRLFDQILGAQPLGQAAHAPDRAQAFVLPVAASR